MAAQLEQQDREREGVGDTEGRLEVFNSAREGHLHSLRVCLDSKSEEEVKRLVHEKTNGATPLIVACRHGHVAIVEYLVNSCHVDFEQAGSVTFDGEIIDGAPPLWCASAAGHVEVVKFLVRAGTSVNNTTMTNSTPLRAACFDGHFAVVQFLVESGADVEIANRHGHTCLMISCYKGHMKIVRYLLERGADVNKKSLKGNTALHDCAEAGSLEIMKILLEHNALIARDSYGMTPLLAGAVTGNTKIVEYLISREDCSSNEKVEALKLLGATFVDKKRDLAGAVKYWRRALAEELDRSKRAELAAAEEELKRKKAELIEKKAELDRRKAELLDKEALLVRKRAELVDKETLLQRTREELSSKTEELTRLRERVGETISAVRCQGVELEGVSDEALRAIGERLKRASLTGRDRQVGERRDSSEGRGGFEGCFGLAGGRASPLCKEDFVGGGDGMFRCEEGAVGGGRSRSSEGQFRETSVYNRLAQPLGRSLSSNSESRRHAIGLESANQSCAYGDRSHRYNCIGQEATNRSASKYGGHETKQRGSSGLVEKSSAGEKRKSRKARNQGSRAGGLGQYGVRGVWGGEGEGSSVDDEYYDDDVGVKDDCEDLNSIPDLQHLRQRKQREANDAKRQQQQLNYRRIEQEVLSRTADKPIQCEAKGKMSHRHSSFELHASPADTQLTTRDLHSRRPRDSDFRQSDTDLYRGTVRQRRLRYEGSSLSSLQGVGSSRGAWSSDDEWRASGGQLDGRRMSGTPSHINSWRKGSQLDTGVNRWKKTSDVNSENSGINGQGLGARAKVYTGSSASASACELGVRRGGTLMAGPSGISSVGGSRMLKSEDKSGESERRKMKECAEISRRKVKAVAPVDRNEANHAGGAERAECKLLEAGSNVTDSSAVQNNHLIGSSDSENQCKPTVSKSSTQEGRADTESGASLVEAYRHTAEATTFRELDDLSTDPDAMRMHALVVRERILGASHPDTSYYIRYRGAVYADMGDYHRCLELWTYALELQQRHLDPLSPLTQSSFLSFAELFSFMINADAKASAAAEPGAAERPVQQKLRFEDMLSLFLKAVLELERSLNFNNKPSKDRDLGNLNRFILIIIHLIALMCKRITKVTPDQLHRFKTAVYRVVRLNPRGFRGATPLHMACSRETTNVGRFPVSAFPDPTVVSILLEVGARVDAVDHDRSTPLHIAARFATVKGCQEVISKLLNAGAHIDACNCNRLTPAGILGIRVGISPDPEPPVDRSGFTAMLVRKPMRYMSLKCMAARKVMESEVGYSRKTLPEKLEAFIRMH